MTVLAYLGALVTYQVGIRLCRVREQFHAGSNCHLDCCRGGRLPGAANVAAVRSQEGGTCGSCPNCGANDSLKSRELVNISLDGLHR